MVENVPLRAVPLRLVSLTLLTDALPLRLRWNKLTQGESDTEEELLLLPPIMNASGSYEPST